MERRRNTAEPEKMQAKATSGLALGDPAIVLGSERKGRNYLVSVISSTLNQLELTAEINWKKANPIEISENPIEIPTNTIEMVQIKPRTRHTQLSLDKYK